MKAYITREEWLKIEESLARANIGYQVIFDDHNGQVEMLVNIDTISIDRTDLEEE